MSAGYNYGLLVYFFFQRIISLVLLVSMVNFDCLSYSILFVKLGLFPFHFWVVIIGAKMSLLMLTLVLGLQKLSLFRLLSMYNLNIYFVFLLLIIVFRYSFVVNILLHVNDFWLSLVHTSVVNGVLVIVGDFNYLFSFFFFYVLIFVSRIFISLLDLGRNLSYLIILFIAVPGYLMFTFKVFIVLGLLIKVIIFLFIFEVSLLFYYFSVFLRFFLIAIETWVVLNLIFIFLVLICGGNYDTMIVLH